MTNFREAFLSGQEAAVKADMAWKEINEVFDEMNAQLAQETEGKIKIRREEYIKFGGIAGTMATIMGTPREKYLALSAWNPKAADGSLVELARWEQGRAGYPCRVLCGDIDETCHDRESLENALAMMLKDAIVGEKLRQLMGRPAASDKHDTQ